MASPWSAELKNGDARIPQAECFLCHPEAMGLTLLAFVWLKSKALAGFSEGTYCKVAQTFQVALGDPPATKLPSSPCLHRLPLRRIFCRLRILHRPLLGGLVKTELLLPITCGSPCPHRFSICASLENQIRVV
ncbi:hypothetical protein M758_2G153200 [Ceratodon purpureus]|nr:hypothetical protein M758_2G153200 [Ceratodon purpureus]